MEIHKLEEGLSAWHKAKYGRSEIDVPKTMRKLGEEFGEFVEAVMGGEPAKVCEEAADVLFVMSHIVRHFADTGALGLAAEMKLKEVRRRLVFDKSDALGFTPAQPDWLVAELEQTKKYLHEAVALQSDQGLELAELKEQRHTAGTEPV